MVEARCSVSSVLTSKPVTRTVGSWTNESRLDLQAYSDCTDWSVTEVAAIDLNALVDSVTSYIGFCEDTCANKDLSLV